MFLLHHGLNAGWYGSLRRGKWTGIRAAQTVIDGLLLVDMLALMVSGVTMSRHVFGFLRLGGMGLAHRSRYFPKKLENPQDAFAVFVQAI